MENSHRTFQPTIENLAFRAATLARLRLVLDLRGYIEVETPQRVRSPGTDVHLNAFASEDRFLITSPEFHMKRLLTAGLPRIYQICHCFRKGERTPLHTPEFTLLEFYAVEMDLEGMMAEIEGIVYEVAAGFNVTEVTCNDRSCSLKPPWQRLSVDEAFGKHAGWPPVREFDEERFYYDLVDKVERNLGFEHPTLLYHYPAPLAMLAKTTLDDPPVARRFEVYVAGIELANAFEELTDPAEQRDRFEKDLATRRTKSLPAYPIDDVFLDALPSMPPCSGIAVGIDRLIMLLAGAGSIDEVIAFPDEKV